MSLCDAEIRPFLRQFVVSQHDHGSVMLLDEFPLYGGDVRADVVAINGTLHGYEIKSERDTLDRLPRQVNAYGKVFDRASAVVSERHLDGVRAALPSWWEILLVQSVGGGVCFKHIQRGRANPDRQAHAITALLWKAEALEILTAYGLEGGMKSATMSEMMDKLANNVPVKKLAEHVRQKLRARGDWLSASRQKRDGEKSRPHANSSRSRRTLYSRTSV